MKIQLAKRIPSHIISGFLGAGKTTLLKALLAQKPAGETWAVLMNEFGQIGVDQQLLPNSEGYQVQELLGGCLCCSSQLPMQLALSRLLSESQPDRLFIEPTGLGHPAQLMEQLTEPHWQLHLDMRALLTVVDGSRLHDSAWTTQHLYADQLKAAEVIVISHADAMQAADHAALDELKQEYHAYAQQWLLTSQGQLSLQEIDRPHTQVQRQIQALIKIQKQQPPEQAASSIKQLPYHYVESAQGYAVAGWKLPKRWCFDFYALLDLLCEQQDWLRIKAIFHTDQGWKSFNFNPANFNYQSCAEQVDNRIEIIYNTPRDWERFESQLLACQLPEQH